MRYLISISLRISLKMWTETYWEPNGNLDKKSIQNLNENRMRMLLKIQSCILLFFVFFDQPFLLWFKYWKIGYQLFVDLHPRKTPPHQRPCVAKSSFACPMEWRTFFYSFSACYDVSDSLKLKHLLIFVLLSVFSTFTF
jgi:hypothetical protein